MKIAHLADLHLGYRAYHRATPRGVNVREADVAAAFHQAIAEIIAIRPELVLVAGDVFHTVRPSNSAIADAFRQFSVLTARLPGVPVVVIAGNHDSPRSSDTGNILALFREIPGLRIVTEGAERVALPEIDAAVLCLPHNALAAAREDAAQLPDGPGELPDVPDADETVILDSTGGRVRIEPDPAVATNVLMLHGTVSGNIAEQRIRYVSEYGGVSVADTAIGPAAWDYVALGHYHIATELAPNMWYAGGIERTSTTIWMEAEGPKGFLVYDTERRSARFHPLDTRPVVDLPRLAARGMGAADIDGAIQTEIDAIPGGIDGKIVRQVVQDIPRHVVRELDHRRIRELKAEALHFHLDARPPEVRRLVGSGAPIRRQTLAEQVEGYLRSHWTPSEAIERDRLVALGRVYVDQAGEEV